MPVQSPSGLLLEKWLSIDLNSLRALNSNHPEEALELIGRIRRFVFQIRPDLFTPPHTNERTQHGGEVDDPR